MGKSEREYVVLRRLSAEDQSWEVVSTEPENKREALQWIKKEGKDGEVYAPAVLTGAPVKVDVTKVAKRDLNKLQPEKKGEA